jgi:hypothetical protein
VIVNPPKQASLKGFKPLAGVSHKEAPGRVVVVETVYHQPVDGVGTAFETRCTIDCQGDEQLYTRRRKIGGTREPLLMDCWVRNPSVVLIQNHDQRVTLLLRPGGCSDEAAISVLPGNSLRFSPVEAQAWSLHTSFNQGGSSFPEAWVTVTVFPR